jgi:disulfide oxidoreductase YuzD
MENSLISWLENWFLSNCNNDWEHSYGITIETTDNPGWYIKIDLKNTSLENEEREYILTEKNENDWYGIKVENAEFVASGDPSKLSLLLNIFKKMVEEKNNYELYHKI